MDGRSTHTRVIQWITIAHNTALTDSNVKWKTQCRHLRTQEASKSRCSFHHGTVGEIKMILNTTRSP